MVRWTTLALVAALSTSSAAVAADTEETWATPEAADAAARKAFAAGRYEEAAEAFSRAYELDPDPRLAANLGEVYRRMGDCPRALEYFDRYLAATKTEAARARVSPRAEALRAQCGDSEPKPPPAAPGSSPRATSEPPATPVEPPPTATAPPPNPTAPEPPQQPQPAPAVVEDVDVATTSPSPWRLGLEAGVALGRWESARSTSPAVRLTGAHVWEWGQWGLGAGAGLQWSKFGYSAADFAPEPYDASATALEAVGEAQARLRLSSWLSLRIDLGGGLTWFSGFDPSNEIATDGAAAPAGARPTARAALGVELDLPIEGLALRLTPAAGTYTAGPSGIGSKLSFGGAAGLGIRL